MALPSRSSSVCNAFIYGKFGTNSTLPNASPLLCEAWFVFKDGEPTTSTAAAWQWFGNAVHTGIDWADGSRNSKPTVARLAAWREHKATL